MATYADTLTENITNSLTFIQLSDQSYTFTSYLNVVQSIKSWIPNYLLENIDISDSVTTNVSVVLYELIVNSDAISSTGIFGVINTDSTKFNDIVKSAITLILLEDLNITSSNVGVKELVSILVELLRLNDTSLTNGELYEIAIASVALSEVLKNVELGDLSEIIDISMVDEVLTSFNISQIEDFTLSLLSSPTISFFSIIEEGVEIDDTQNLAIVLNMLNEESVVFSTTFIDPTEIEAFVFNPENTAMSTYTNFDFTSAVEFGQYYLFANNTGLYRHSGTTDNSSFITSIIKTATMDFDISNKKQMPQIYLGVNNDSKLIMRASIDGRNTAYYQLNLESHNLDTQMIKLGKGLVGRYWQFEIQTKENEGLDIDTLEFYPITFGRKI